MFVAYVYVAYVGHIMLHTVKCRNDWHCNFGEPGHFKSMKYETKLPVLKFFFLHGKCLQAMLYDVVCINVFSIRFDELLICRDLDSVSCSSIFCFLCDNLDPKYSFPFCTAFMACFWMWVPFLTEVLWYESCLLLWLRCAPDFACCRCRFAFKTYSVVSNVNLWYISDFNLCWH